MRMNLTGIAFAASLCIASAAFGDDYFAARSRTVDMERWVQKDGISHDADYDVDFVGQVFAEYQGSYEISTALQYGMPGVPVWNVSTVRTVYREVRNVFVPVSQRVIKFRVSLTGPRTSMSPTAPKFSSLPPSFQFDDMQYAGYLNLPSGVSVALRATEIDDVITDLPFVIAGDASGDYEWEYDWGNLADTYEDLVGGRYFVLEGEFTFADLPEPTTFALLLGGAALMIRRRR